MPTITTAEVLSSPMTLGPLLQPKEGQELVDRNTKERNQPWKDIVGAEIEATAAIKALAGEKGVVVDKFTTGDSDTFYTQTL